MNSVTFGYFSVSRHAENNDDRPYLGWHQLDHMPEQYQLAGIAGGQRWASTSACRSSRAAEVGDWATAAHVVSYLMREPIEETLDEFQALGRRLGEMGRYSLALPSQFQGALSLLEAQAAPRALVSAQVVPFRPNRGIYFIVEERIEGERWDEYLRLSHSETVPELLSVPGVAGVWIFGSAPMLRHRDLFSPGRYRMTLCYLDDDPATVGERLAEPLERSWKGAPTRPLLAAPFESMMIWDWERFEPGRDVKDPTQSRVLS